MEERLAQIGDWLKINGEAIYGTKPWKAAQQWSAGDVPKVEYNKEYSTPYDVTRLTEKSESGKASIEAFFTTKNSDLYAILPHWSSRSNLMLKDVTGAKSVSLLGSATSLRFRISKAGVAVSLPDLPEQLRQQPAWVLKISQQ
jgi:alpha-L-fucosidase